MASLVQDKTATVRSGGVSGHSSRIRPQSSRVSVNIGRRSSQRSQMTNVKSSMNKTSAFDITKHHHPVYEVGGLPK